MRSTYAVVLAAGQGTRMRSTTPKMMHTVCGRSLLHCVLAELLELDLKHRVVVVGQGATEVEKMIGEQFDVPIDLVTQERPLGTADAVGTALATFAEEVGDAEDDVLVLPGDAPLLRAETLKTLLDAHQESDTAATLLTARVDDPNGYGRVVRDGNDLVAKVVEHADANPDERKISEINTSVYAFRRSLLSPALRRIQPDNVKGEFYLTDVIAVLREAGHQISAVIADDPGEVMGVNDRVQLANANAIMRRRINERWMRDGVTIVQPENTYIEFGVTIDTDTQILPGTVLSGATTIGSNCVIGPDSSLSAAVVGDDVRINRSEIHEAVLDNEVTIGPFAFIRPGTHLHEGVHVGAHVEIKNSEIGARTKIPHLSYVGDADVGEDANLGAGTITANYDGREKHRTKIGNNVKTGVHTVLVAPVAIGDGAWTAAGAVVTKDVPPGALAKGVPARIEKDWVTKHT